ncbi:MAG: membrane protein insertase YidC [Candidatus Competibacteraceae bacterium]
MENQRLLVVFALLFVMFLIWQRWLDFQAQKHPPAPPPQATTTTTTDSTTATQPPAQPEVGSDRLDMPSVAAPADTSAPAAELHSAQRVRVLTDLFEVEIDTALGDLRYVGLRTFPESLQQQDQPFALLKDNGSEIFIAQSGLLSSDPTLALPNHYTENDFRFSAEQSEYRLKDGEETLDVALTWTSESGLKLIKTYSFQRGSFVIDLTHRVENGSAEDWTGRQYRQFLRTPPPTKSGGFFTGGVYTYTGGVISTPAQRYEKVSFDDMAEKDLSMEVTGGWVAMIQHYFLGAWIPEQDRINGFFTRKTPGLNRYVIGMVAQDRSVAAGETLSFNTRLYVGPKIQDQLEEVAPNLRLTVDYGFLTVIAQPLFWLLELIHTVVRNWGWAIIVLTILIKAAFFKLSETSYKSMANMRRLAPKMAQMKERYGDDKQRMNQAMMDLYKKEKINPLSGCLPIAVQIPVFIALYWVLLESVELRQAPFMLWIQDLSIKDPYYVLPLIMGVTMFIQQKLNPAPPDPIQPKVMMALPVVFTFFFLFFPAGLVLYWVVNNVLSIAQQYVITKRIEAGAKA